MTDKTMCLLPCDCGATWESGELSVSADLSKVFCQCGLTASLPIWNRRASATDGDYVRVPKEPVCEMALCEQRHLILREGQLYRFHNRGGCAECDEISKIFAPAQAAGEEQKAAAGSGGQDSATTDSHESPADEHCQSAASEPLLSRAGESPMPEEPWQISLWRKQGVNDSVTEYLGNIRAFATAETKRAEAVSADARDLRREMDREHAARVAAERALENVLETFLYPPPEPAMILSWKKHEDAYYDGCAAVRNGLKAALAAAKKGAQK